MEYRVLTVSREFGSGGGRIAQIVARRLGWKLLDQEIIGQIARAAHVDSHVVKHYDEHVDSWLRRVNEEAIRGVALAAGRPLAEEDIFDAHAMVDRARNIIEEACGAGNCVIVGRGAQCILQHRHDAFHVFVYAPLRERIERLKKRLEPGADVEQRLRTVDGDRAKYLHQQFGRHWCDPHLYDLMLRSTDDEDAAAHVILYAMTGTPAVGSEANAAHVSQAS
ncbi:MAG: cytidylate kinase-like family protein [Terracidiphilus sp.]